MIQKTARYLWSVRWQFVKYSITGMSSVVLDFISLIVLKERFGVAPVVAVIINQAFLLGYNFSLNKYWTFRNRAVPHRQIVRYATLAAWNYFFSVAAMYVFNTVLAFDYRIVRLGSIGVMVSWNFLLYKHWVYREETIPPALS